MLYWSTNQIVFTLSSFNMTISSYSGIYIRLQCLKYNINISHTKLTLFDSVESSLHFRCKHTHLTHNSFIRFNRRVSLSIGNIDFAKSFKDSILVSLREVRIVHKDRKTTRLNSSDQIV